MDMIRAKAADIAEQAATLLQELAHLLRSDRSETSQRVESAPPVEVTRPAEATRPVDVARPAENTRPVEITRPVDVTPKDKVAAMFPPVSRRQKEEVARRLKVFWEGVSLEPNLQVGRCDIDLTSTQGRFELLILAVLMGARVSQRVIDDTFEALKDKGLLDLEVLATATPGTRSDLEAIIQERYRALTSKAAKVDALLYNASHLQRNWRGDLNTIYDTHKGDPTQMLRALRQFRHISRMALWICRTMCAHGIWKDIDPSLTWYFDRASNLPLRRLGYVSGDGDTQRYADLQAVISDFFDSELLYLYLHGTVLCSLDDIDTCWSRCPVATWCSYPQQPS